MWVVESSVVVFLLAPSSFLHGRSLSTKPGSCPTWEKSHIYVNDVNVMSPRMPAQEAMLREVFLWVILLYPLLVKDIAFFFFFADQILIAHFFFGGGGMSSGHLSTPKRHLS